MNEKKRVLVCEFHQESNTFNPTIETYEGFLNPQKPVYGEELYSHVKGTHTPLGGIIKSVVTKKSYFRFADFVFHICIL
jgi:hypothetical protein